MELGARDDLRLGLGVVSLSDETWEMECDEQALHARGGGSGPGVSFVRARWFQTGHDASDGRGAESGDGDRDDHATSVATFFSGGATAAGRWTTPGCVARFRGR
jgi:hypothetical protein